MPAGDIAVLVKFLAENSARVGDFTLASGAKSDLYIDARLTTMSPRGLSLLGPLGLELIRSQNWSCDSVGGLTLGADPIAYAISYASTLFPPTVRAFTVRKERKAHGTQKLIEGPFKQDDRVVIIEDVITSGQSALRAIEVVRDAGARVLGVLAVVDREEGGAAALSAVGVELAALTTAAEIRSQV